MVFTYGWSQALLRKAGTKDLVKNPVPICLMKKVSLLKNSLNFAPSFCGEDFYSHSAAVYRCSVMFDTIIPLYLNMTLTVLVASVKVKKVINCLETGFIGVTNHVLIASRMFKGHISSISETTKGIKLKL